MFPSINTKAQFQAACHTYGKENKDDQYNGGTLFIDHASSMVFIQHQVSLCTGETPQAKHKFEQLACEHGVAIKSYHADNSPFGNADFVHSIEDHGQAIKFSGVGAHHQNGVAERTSAPGLIPCYFMRRFIGPNKTISPFVPMPSSMLFSYGTIYRTVQVAAPFCTCNQS